MLLALFSFPRNPRPAPMAVIKDPRDLGGEDPTHSHGSGVSWAKQRGASTSPALTGPWMSRYSWASSLVEEGPRTAEGSPEPLTRLSKQSGLH